MTYKLWNKEKKDFKHRNLNRGPFKSIKILNELSITENVFLTKSCELKNILNIIISLVGSFQNKVCNN